MKEAVSSLWCDVFDVFGGHNNGGKVDEMFNGMFDTMVDTAGFDQPQTIEHLKTTQQAVREMRRSMVWFMLGMKTRTNT